MHTESSFVLFISSHFTPVGVHCEEGNRNQLEKALTKANNNIGYNEQEAEIAEGDLNVIGEASGLP